MAKNAVLTISASIDPKYKKVYNENANLGFFLKIGGELYDIDLGLFKVELSKNDPNSAFINGYSDCEYDRYEIFPDIDANVIELT